MVDLYHLQVGVLSSQLELEPAADPQSPGVREPPSSRTASSSHCRCLLVLYSTSTTPELYLL